MAEHLRWWVGNRSPSITENLIYSDNSPVDLTSPPPPSSSRCARSDRPRWSWTRRPPSSTAPPGPSATTGPPARRRHRRLVPGLVAGHDHVERVPQSYSEALIEIAEHDAYADAYLELEEAKSTLEIDANHADKDLKLAIVAGLPRRRRNHANPVFHDHGRRDPLLQPRQRQRLVHRRNLDVDGARHRRRRRAPRSRPCGRQTPTTFWSLSTLWPKLGRGIGSAATPAAANTSTPNTPGLFVSQESSGGRSRRSGEGRHRHHRHEDPPPRPFGADGDRHRVRRHRRTHEPLRPAGGRAAGPLHHHVAVRMTVLDLAAGLKANLATIDINASGSRGETQPRRSSTCGPPRSSTTRRCRWGFRMLDVHGAVILDYIDDEGRPGVRVHGPGGAAVGCCGRRVRPHARRRRRRCDGDVVERVEAAVTETNEERLTATWSVIVYVSSSG